MFGTSVSTSPPGRVRSARRATIALVGEVLHQALAEHDVGYFQELLAGQRDRPPECRPQPRRRAGSRGPGAQPLAE